MMFAVFRLVDMGPQGHMRPALASLFANSHVRRLFLMQNKQVPKSAQRLMPLSG